MTEYHKIQSIFKRDMQSRQKTLIEGAWTLPEFEYLAENEWTFTEKVDGTNIRVVVDSGMPVFAGRTDNAQIPAPLVARLNERFLPMTELLRDSFPGGAVLYGEGYGPKIQGGGKYRPDQDFVLFDVRVGRWWLEREGVESVAKTLGLDVVPVIGSGTLFDAVELVRYGMLSRWGGFEAEGIVARPRVELNTRGGNRLIAKIKCRDFVGR